MKDAIELRVADVPEDWRGQLGIEELDENERVRLSLQQVSGPTRHEIIDMVLATPTTKNAGPPTEVLIRQARDEREERFRRLQDETRAKRKPRKSTAQ